MDLRNTTTDLMMKGANYVHRGLLAISGGRIGGTVGEMPVVQLHTTGRKSGKRRTTMLTAPVAADDRYVLVASKGGDDRHPAWYLNLVDEPDVELTVDGTTMPMTARVLDDDEKHEVWPAIVESYDGYRKYQDKTDRDIPVISVEPRSA